MLGTLLVTAAVLSLLIALNALYVAAEFAAVSTRRARLRGLADGGSRAARRLLPVVEDAGRLDRYIAACQIGITLSSLVVGFYGQARLAPLLGPALSTGVAATLVLALLTSAQVVFGELIPKSVAMRFPERLALLTSLPMLWSLVVLRPFIALLNGSALALLRLLGLEREGDLHAHSPEELELIFRDSAEGGHLDREEREMLENTLALDHMLARQIMIPRTRLAVADVRRPAKSLLAELSRTPYTRFPVTEGGIDKVIGTLHLRDLFRLARAQTEADIREVVRDPLLLPESNTVGEVWDAMQEQGTQLAVLFDEYGGTVGIVTLEDILEEVVGEVQDEFDDEAERVREDEDGRLHVRGDVTVASVNRTLLLDLPLDGADTIGGLLVEGLGRAPREGDEAQFDGVTLRAGAVEANAVTRVVLELPDGRTDEDEDETP